MDIIDEFIQFQTNRGLSKQTVLGKEFHMRRFKQYTESLGISLYLVERQTIIDYYTTLKESSLAEVTIYKYISVVFEFYQWLVDKGEFLINPAFRVTSPDRQTVPKKIVGGLTIEQMCQTLYSTGDNLDYRDALLLDITYTGGLRKGEIQRLNCGDVDIENRLVRLKGKGGHERVVPIGIKCAKQVLQYTQTIRPKLIKKGCPSALFLSYKTGQRITIVGIGRMFDRINERFDLRPKLTPHSLRHACATDLLRNGAPIQDISKILGHVDIRTTEIYTRVSIEDLKAQYKQYHPRA